MIQVNDKIRIVRIDKLNLELQEYRCVVDKKTKAERYDWCWVGYYGDLRSAIGGMFKHCLMELTEKEVKGWQEIVDKIDEIEKMLKGAVENAN